MVRRAFKQNSIQSRTPTGKRAARTNQERVDILRQQMDIAAIDVLICRLPQNVLMIAGYWPTTGNSFVVFPRLGEPVLILPGEEAVLAEASWIKDVRSFELSTADNVNGAVQQIVRDIAQEKGLQRLVIGYEGTLEDIGCSRPLISCPGPSTFQMLQSVFPEADFHDASDMLDLAQMVKTPAEVEAIKIATEVAFLGLKAADRNVAVGLRESEVLAMVHKEVLAGGIGLKGARSVQGFCRVTSGPRSSEAYHPLVSTSDREIRPGDTVLVEVEVCADGFWSKLARTLIVGSPSSKIQEAYDICLDAQRKAVEAISDGAKAGEVDNVVRSYVAKRGYGEEFKTRLGHGIGFSVSPRSRPRFRTGSEDVLRPYVVHTLEPALFIPGLVGIKVCDVVVDLGQGVEYFRDQDSRNSH